MPKSLIQAVGDDGNDLLDFSAYQNQPLAGIGSIGDSPIGGAGDGHGAAAGIPNVDGGLGSDHVAAGSQFDAHALAAAAAAAAPAADPNAVIVIPGTHNLVIDGLHQSGEYFLV